MAGRLRERFAYRLERLFVRGAQYRLALIAAGIGLLSVAGGVLVLALGSGFDDVGAAVWWAFLRLTDPGYLGDDVGTVNRVVSTALTVAGYVVFLGALVAVMTQWLDARMKRLEAGLTPVARNDHVLVLGWTNRTDTVVEELLRSEERVRRFLRRHGTRDLHVVVMADQVDATRLQDLRDAVGDAWDESRVTLRSGSSLRLEHLARVDYLNAAAVIVPGTEFGGGGVGQMDARTVKTLLSLGSEPEGGRRPETDELPLTVAEVFDARKVPVARRAYRGELELVASDAVVSRLLAQNARHPGLSRVYNRILSHGEGAEIFLRRHPELGGRRFEDVALAFDGAVLMGVVRREAGRGSDGTSGVGRGEARDGGTGADGARGRSAGPAPGGGPRGSSLVPRLNPPAGFELEADDWLVFLTESYGGAELPGELPETGPPRGEPTAAGADGGGRSVLVLGWNHKVPVLLEEFGSYRGERFEVRVLSTVPAAERRAATERYEVPDDRVTVEQVEGDFTDLSVLREARPGERDVVMLVGSDRLETEEESDARSIVGSLLLDELVDERGGPARILELLDPENVPLVEESRGEVMISPLILSHMLAHVALRPELRAVFEELFTVGGAEITFRPLAEYGPDAAGTAGGGDVEDAVADGASGQAPRTFGELQRAAFARGEIALGVRSGPGARGTHLNPPPETPLPPDGEGSAVTLVTY